MIRDNLCQSVAKIFFLIIALGLAIETPLNDPERRARGRVQRHRVPCPPGQNARHKKTLWVLSGREFSFPEDHNIHPDFLTEWWYITANLLGEDGITYGAQFTLF